MYNDEYEHFSFLDLFNEAEDDDNTGADAGGADEPGQNHSPRARHGVSSRFCAAAFLTNRSGPH